MKAAWLLFFYTPTLGIEYLRKSLVDLKNKREKSSALPDSHDVCSRTQQKRHMDMIIRIKYDFYLTLVKEKKVDKQKQMFE